ncbi:MAG: hypothetical protein ACM339_09850 [Ignavibacteria bacterium]
MKKYILHLFLFFFAAAASFTILSCDEFNTFPINIPITFEFTVTGSDSDYDSGIYCLSESEAYQEYRENAESITYLKAQYRTISISDNSVEGTINIRVLNSSGTAIIDFTETNFAPADYISSAFTITLEQNEIQAFNTYLNSLPDDQKCFRVVIAVTGINGTQTLNGAVDVVFEVETKF